MLPASNVVLDPVATSGRDRVMECPATSTPAAYLAEAHRVALSSPVNPEADSLTTGRRSLRFLHGSFFEEIIEENITLNGFVKRTGVLEDAHKAAIDNALMRASLFLQESLPLTRLKYETPYLVGSPELLNFPEFNDIEGLDWSRAGLVDDQSRSRFFDADHGEYAFWIHSALVMSSADRSGFYDPEVWVESVDGHASQTGPEKANMEYSRERAASVAAYLAQRSRSSPAGWIRFKGTVNASGSSRPAFDLPGFELPENRRATFRLVKRRIIAHIPTANEFEMEYRFRIQEVAQWPIEEPDNIIGMVRRYDQQVHPDLDVNIDHVRFYLQEQLTLAYNAEALANSSTGRLPLERYNPLSVKASRVPENWALNPLHVYIDGDGKTTTALPPRRRAIAAFDALKRSDRLMQTLSVEHSLAASAAIHRWIVLQEAARASVVLQYSLNLKQVSFDTYIEHVKREMRGNLAENVMNDVVDFLRGKPGRSNILKDADTVPANRHFLENNEFTTRARRFVEEHFR